MASETVDGPRFGSSDPDFPNMLSNESYNAIEALFSILYMIEFSARWLSAPSQVQFWKSIPTWISLLAAIAAVPKLIDLALNLDTSKADIFMFNLRILRVVRLIVLSYAYIGTKVLFRAALDAIAPLTITLFFLITVVMVFATAIFYAEPCYDLETCTFTDIFNAGYFVMLTVATVGYGSQVPSIHNAGSLLIGCTVMIFGTFYFSMPLAIIGIKYELAWGDYDALARNWKEHHSQRKRARLQKSASNLSSRSRILKGHAIEEDISLEKIEAYTIKYASSVTCDRFYQLSQKILNLHFALQAVVSCSTDASDTPITLESVIQTTKRRSDEASQALDGVMSVIKFHSRVCSEAHELLQQTRGSTSTEPDSGLDRFLATISGNLGGKEKFGAHSVSRMSRAKGAIATLGSRAVKSITHLAHHTEPNSLRAVIWNVFEYRQDIWVARVANRIRMYIVVLSIIVFYLQTTPELQKTGERTFLCQRNIHDYCAVYEDPGCYVFKKVASSDLGFTVEVTNQPLDLHCSLGDPDETCYASGVNFGSANFPLSCSDVFPSTTGVQHVCKTRLCKPPVQFLFDMEPYWVYFEFVIGISFTLEFVLRVYSHPARSRLFGDPKTLANMVILLPFYVELVEIMIGLWPAFSVVPTMPSFFTAVRVLKSLRILKLGTHIPGARVLINTTRLISSRIVIPLFFLFLGCVVSAAIFFEIERGTECFVGETCLWWGKNVLTPELSEGLPDGKRVLVQNTFLTIITDMLRSTWFSLVSFTTVGYGDLYPRTSMGRLLDILGMIFSSCYTAMPLTLVGGQFYVCYELHAQEEKRKRENGQRIKPNLADNAAIVQSLMLAFPSVRSIREKSEPAPSDEAESVPVANPNRTLAMTSMTSLKEPAELTPLPTLHVLPGARKASQYYTHSTELQITNHFFLMQKVFHETIKDISLLNRLGIQRINTTRKNSLPRTELGTLLVDIRSQEQVVETKISENMDFCVTACLNFAAMIERVLGTEKMKTQQPPVVHTNALLASADPTNSLLTSSANSRRNVMTDLLPQPLEPNQAPTMTPTIKLRSKNTSLKKMATLSKIFVSPVLQNQKWAEYSNKQSSENGIPE
ncbi:Potassium voltage-gated channel subfamily C member 2 [Phytophthora ramorum]|uniref:Potassium voltage-gated channel subfamily C member 2 n=1 Tax=Phytophthora ramorum TaxID=164328 RepID=UPI0030A602C5|nr:Potassium voltage-gated channel subfamily C member 2 [Phytophthora ramorum]